MNGRAPSKTQPGFVELQLLRHGPPHNQLLSPLTEYLALCGDHTNTTLRIPLEHSALETRLRALRYLDSEQTRGDQLRETARIASDLLAKVPGLIADLSADYSAGRPFVHLSVASRASELALFPFELALAPDGFPGAGQPLCLQKQLPVCLTRRSKNIRNDDFPWDREIKILFVASDAGGPIPVVQHYAVLRKLIEPWVGVRRGESPDEIRNVRRRVFRFIAAASIEKIEAALCDEINDYGVPFTHIHVLAHGCDLPDSDRRSGVAFYRGNTSEIDAVDGKRLAEALGCLPDYPTAAKRRRGPTVVTLATCSSADQGGVLVPGASLAFELHDSGVPLVVGSQFPLSSEGSIVMTESLYRGFLAGRDPRSVVWEARRALHTNLRQAPAGTSVNARAPHDWASMTVYAAFPESIDAILPVHRRRRQQQRMNVRLRNMHRTIGHMADESVTSEQEASDSLSEADKAVKKFETWTRCDENNDTEALKNNRGILASAQKQVGLLHLRTLKRPNLNQESKEKWLATGMRYLQFARETYWSIFELSRDASWALTQSISLKFSLSGEFEEDDCRVAARLAQIEEHLVSDQQLVWSVASLVELDFLSALSKTLPDPRSLHHPEKTSTRETSRQALGLPDSCHARVARIVKQFSQWPWEVLSAWRQFDRYTSIFAQLACYAVFNPTLRTTPQANVGKHAKTASPIDAVLDLLPANHPYLATIEAIRQVNSQFDEIDFDYLLSQERNAAGS